MGAAVVDNPEHPLRRGVGLGGHHLFDQPGEGLDAGRGLAAAEDLRPVDVVGGQVRQCSAPVVLVLDAHEAGLARCQGGVAAAASLD
jgi:hypothetical protein